MEGVPETNLVRLCWRC